MRDMESYNPTGLTAREIQLLKEANKELSKSPDAMRTIFVEYFRRYPHNQEFFPFNGVPLEELPADPDFKKQCILVTSFMTACIENLDDYEVVVRLLTSLGENHKKYNIPSESFWESRNVIVEGLSKVVNEETYTAYAKYWDFVVETTLKASTPIS